MTAFSTARWLFTLLALVARCVDSVPILSVFKAALCTQACISGKGARETSDSMMQCQCSLPKEYGGMKPLTNGIGTWKQQPRLRELPGDVTDVLSKQWRADRHFIKVSRAELNEWVERGFPPAFQEGKYGYAVSAENPFEMRIFRFPDHTHPTLKQKVREKIPGPWWMDVILEDSGHTSVFSKREFKDLRTKHQRLIYAGEFTLDGQRKVDHWSNGSGHFRPPAKDFKKFGHVWGLKPKHFDGNFGAIGLLNEQDLKYEDSDVDFEPSLSLKAEIIEASVI